MVENKSSYIGSLSPEYAILGFLSQSASHGYLIHKQLKSDLDQIWHISLSQTYNILNRLEAAGFIEGKLLKQSKLPSRREYYLTDSGRHRFESWLNSPSQSSVKTIRVEFITRLYFASQLSIDLAERIIYEQRTTIRNGLERLNKIKNVIPKEQIFNHLGVNLRLKQLESILDWLDECDELIREFYTT